MDESKLRLPTGRNMVEVKAFGKNIEEICSDVGFKFSARGWGYYLEGLRLINKENINQVENLVNRCRKLGFLPVDFVAEEEGRQFGGIEKPQEESPEEDLKEWLITTLNTGEIYTPDWWEGEEYYLQMVVEKIDLKTLFTPIVKNYKIPIASSKGWASITMRASYARRFKEAEAKGLKCVLLYCGDLDPDGLRISEHIRKNLKDLQNIFWEDGEEGYSPDDLIIDRFGLNYDFVIENNLTWIDNLTTGSGLDLSTPNHKNHYMKYVQNYLKEIGVRKCEANAITRPSVLGAAQTLCTEAIEKYIPHSLIRFQNKRNNILKELAEFRERTGLEDVIREAINIIDEEDKGDN